MIWVIDDDAFMLKLLGFKIQKLGFNVSLFNSAEEALLNDIPKELSHVFTDINLTGKSGFEVAEMLKGKAHEIQLIALTSSDLSNDERAKMLFDQTFRKPISDAELDSVFEEKFDFPYLNAMIDSEEDKIEIIRHFCEETKRDTKDLENAIRLCDNETMLLLTHRLSGRLAQFSQEEISLGFRHAEQKLAEGNCETEEIERVLEKLDVFIRKLEKV